MAFSAVSSESEEDREDEEEDKADPELLKASQVEVRSRRAIEQSARSADNE